MISKKKIKLINHVSKKNQNGGAYPFKSSGKIIFMSYISNKKILDNIHMRRTQIGLDKTKDKLTEKKKRNEA